MAEIVPAILEENKENFLHVSQQVTKLPGITRIQVDFADGIFVPHHTMEVADISALNPAFLWEAHLMVKKPVDFLDYHISGFGVIVVHYEAFENINDLKLALGEIRSLNLKCGVALNPETDVLVCKELEKFSDQFTLLSVHPGFQKGEFLPEVVDRIKRLRRMLPNAILEVDGGLNVEKISGVVGAGADLLVVGSAIVKAPNMQEAYEKLQAEIKSS